MALPLMDSPEGKGPFQFVLQWHTRGKSVHTDIRFEVNDHLIGFTLDDPGAVGDKPRLSNDAEFSSKHKILAQTKSRQPKEWLTVTGEIAPGEVGATRFLPAKFETKDRGNYEMGSQKPNLFEVFLHGKKYNGRFIATKVARGEKFVKTGKDALVWFFWKPIDQNPYVLSSRSISKEFVPPKGASALPKEFEDKIPKELRWWEKNFTGEKALDLIKEIRKLFLKRDWLSAELRSSEFVLKKRWWKGQKVVRDMPRVFYDLGWEGNGINVFNLDSNPIETSQMNAVKKSAAANFMSFEGTIAPGKPGNPNKKIPAFVDIVDKGRVDIIEETNNFISFKFHGKKLKGFWIAKSSNGQWLFKRSALPGQKKEGLSNELTEEQKFKIAELSKNRDNSLNDIAKEVGCSRSSVRYNLVRFGLK